MAHFIKENRHQIGLFILRFMVAASILASAGQKIFFPEVAFDQLNYVYGVAELSLTELYFIGGAQAIIGVGVLTGASKRVFYLLALTMQITFILGIGTEITTELRLLNLTYFPYLITAAATFTLYMTRDEDTFLAIQK